MRIYFTIRDNTVLAPDMTLRGLCAWHCWRLDDTDPWFCVATPHRDPDADGVVARLAHLGCEVLPALNDPDTNVSDAVKGALAKHGVRKTDRTRDIANKMHGAAGFPPLKPSLY